MGRCESRKSSIVTKLSRYEKSLRLGIFKITSASGWKQPKSWQKTRPFIYRAKEHIYIHSWFDLSKILRGFKMSKFQHMHYLLNVCLYCSYFYGKYWHDLGQNPAIRWFFVVVENAILITIAQGRLGYQSSWGNRTNMLNISQYILPLVINSNSFITFRIF